MYRCIYVWTQDKTKCPHGEGIKTSTSHCYQKTIIPVVFYILTVKVTGLVGVGVVGSFVLNSARCMRETSTPPSFAEDVDESFKGAFPAAGPSRPNLEQHMYK